MARKRPRQHDSRGHIFRSVYEDNMRIVGQRGIRIWRSGPMVSRGSRTFLMLAICVALSSAVPGHQEIQSKPQDAEAVLTPDERIAGEFGGADDPGLQQRDAQDRPLASLYGLAVKTIVIDPGHGGLDPGAIGSTGLTEKAITLDVALRLHRRLADRGFEVLLTRSEDTKVTLRERVDFSSLHEADILVSIHVNALPGNSVSAVETYYFSPRGTSESERVAARENYDSGYTLAQWRRGLVSLGRTMKLRESQLLATYVQEALLRNIRQVNPDVVNWGIKSGPFMVLWGVSIPAILAEISVITAAMDEAMLYNGEYRERLAMSLEAGVIAYLEHAP